MNIFQYISASLKKIFPRCTNLIWKSRNLVSAYKIFFKKNLGVIKKISCLRGCRIILDSLSKKFSSFVKKTLSRSIFCFLYNEIGEEEKNPIFLSPLPPPLSPNLDGGGRRKTRERKKKSGAKNRNESRPEFHLRPSTHFPQDMPAPAAQRNSWSPTQQFPTFTTPFFKKRKEGKNLFLGGRPQKCRNFLLHLSSPPFSSVVIEMVFGSTEEEEEEERQANGRGGCFWW